MVDTVESLISSAIDTLKTPVPTDVKYRGTSMAPAVAANKAVNTSVEQQQQVITDATALTKSATADYKQGQLDAAAAASAQATADAEKAAKVAGNFDVYSGLMETQQQIANIVAGASSAIVMTKPAADQELQNIRQMQSVGLLDDPLEWAYNQIQLPAKIKSYNAVATQLNSAQNTIDEGLKNIASIAEGGVKNVPAITAAQAAATAAAAAAKAKVLNANADEHLATMNVDFATKNTAAVVAAAGVTDATTRLQQAEAENVYRSQIQSIQLADTKANRLISAAKYLETLQDQKQVEVNLSNYEKIMGLAPGSMPYTAWKQLPKEKGLEVIAIGGSGKYGFGPEQALNNMRALGTGANLPDTTKNIIGFLVNAEKAAGDKIKTEMQAVMDNEKLSAAEKTAIHNQKMDAELVHALNTEMANPDSKLFGPATPKEILASVGLPQGLPTNSPLIPILSPLAETNVPVSVKTVFQAIKMAAPNSIQDQGTLLSQYATYARGITMKASNVEAFGKGIVVPKGYKVPALDPILTTPGGQTEIRRRIDLDITDPVEARKYALIQARPEMPFNFFAGRLGSK